MFILSARGAVSSIPPLAPAPSPSVRLFPLHAVSHGVLFAPPSAVVVALLVPSAEVADVSAPLRLQACLLAPLSFGASSRLPGGSVAVLCSSDRRNRCLRASDLTRDIVQGGYRLRIDMNSRTSSPSLKLDSVNRPHHGTRSEAARCWARLEQTSVQSDRYVTRQGVSRHYVAARLELRLRGLAQGPPR